MSINLTVYVGPYLEVPSTVKDDLVWGLEDLLVCGRGEARFSDHDDHRYLIPNVVVPGIARETAFERHGPTPALELRNQAQELSTFAVFARDAIEAIQASGVTCRVTWGVVCGWR